MKKFIIFLLIGVVMSVFALAKAQEVSIYAGGRQQPDQPIGTPDTPDGDEVQDESELASALGIDRQALYEDLMRIQEELGGSPLSPGGDQPSQEDY